jgi:hypothetical protein
LFKELAPGAEIKEKFSQERQDKGISPAKTGSTYICKTRAVLLSIYFTGWHRYQVTQRNFIL